MSWKGVASETMVRLSKQLVIFCLQKEDRSAKRREEWTDESFSKSFVQHVAGNGEIFSGEPDYSSNRRPFTLSEADLKSCSHSGFNSYGS